MLGYLELNEVIRLLAEIGIILLLFSVGLETDVRRIIRTGQKSFIVALVGFFAPFILGFVASYWLSLRVQRGNLSLLNGGKMTAANPMYGLL